VPSETMSLIVDEWSWAILILAGFSCLRFPSFFFSLITQELETLLLKEVVRT